MNIRFLKTAVLVLTFVLLSGCVVLVRDDEGRHHRFRHWRSSIEQSDKSLGQTAARENREPASAITFGEVSR
jgi:hypothetical protein